MKFTVQILTILLFMATGTSFAQNSTPLNLSDYKWENRLLLVFSPNTYNSEFRALNNMIQDHQKGFKERDLKVFYSLTDYGAAFKGTLMEQESSEKLSNQFNISENEFTVLLIGKDGTEKLRVNQALSHKKLFEEIDAMPMRKLEMKQNGK